MFYNAAPVDYTAAPVDCNTTPKGCNTALARCNTAVYNIAPAVSGIAPAVLIYPVANQTPHPANLRDSSQPTTLTLQPRQPLEHSAVLTNYTLG